VSGDTPDIVLNEFGDLSRKARRELEARGIDPDTAVVEYIAATGQMPVITPEAAAAAKAEAQAEAAAVARDKDSLGLVAPAVEVAPVEEPAVARVNTSEPTVLPHSSVLPVSVPVTAAETGPIEPLIVAPALDSGSLSAVEETLAAVSDQTGEVVTSGFDALVTAETVDIPAGPSKGEARRLARKEKKARALAQREEKLSVAADAQANTVREKSAQELREREESELAAEVEALRLREEQEASARDKAELAAEEARLLAQAEEDAQASAVEGAVTEEVLENSVISELEPADDDEFEDEELAPQTISEATAAIAIAEAVAAAEAVVEAGEVNIEFGNLANSVPATTGSISVISNALILPTLPETTGSIAPINPTGEIVITGSILIPSSVSQVGASLENLDTSDIDVIKDDEEVAPTQGMAPVSAATAVSAYNISNSVVTTPRGMNERLPFILSITAAGLAVGVVALFVAGYFLGLF
jgi:hypothetical protein